MTDDEEEREEGRKKIKMRRGREGISLTVSGNILTHE